MALPTITMTFQARCRAFLAEGIRSNRLYWDGDTLRVWDSVAGHYVPSMTISERTARRLVRAEIAQREAQEVES